MKKSSPIFAGLSNVNLMENSYDLLNGIGLRKVYAHLISPNLMAFKRAEEGKHHPAPWRAARGGESIDIEVELFILDPDTLPNKIPAEEAIWWVSTLLRLAAYPFLKVPVISNVSFLEAATGEIEPELIPFEKVSSILKAVDPKAETLKLSDLEWVSENWIIAANLAREHSSLKTAMEAWNYSTITGRTSSSMLALWGALEQLFSPSSGELKFRVSTYIASFLEEAGEDRLRLYREILTLYNERSRAAHSAQEIHQSHLIQSWVILRNALMKIIENEKVPTTLELEHLLLCPYKKLE